MPKNINIIGIVTFFILSFFSLGFCEDITITTYYPSPYGSYDKLTTTGDTYLATSSGSNVGIGTTSPGATLDVNGNARVSAYLGVGGLAADSYRIWTSGGAYGIRAEGSTAGGLFVDNSYDVNTRIAGSGYGIYTDGKAYFGGDVGIGTALPGVKLDVNGQIRIQGGSPGAGKVLTSDVSGLASWQPPIPSGFCIFSDTQTSCPTGWTKKTSFDGNTIRGASAPGGTGGVNYLRGDSGFGAAGFAKYGLNSPSGAMANWPPYIDVLICCKD